MPLRTTTIRQPHHHTAGEHDDAKKHAAAANEHSEMAHEHSTTAHEHSHK